MTLAAPGEKVQVELLGPCGHIKGTLLQNIPKNCPPAGILGEPFYKIFQKIGPCGHIRGILLQHIPKKCCLLSLAGIMFLRPIQI